MSKKNISAGCPPYILYGEWSVRVPHHTFCMVEPVIHFVWGLIGVDVPLISELTDYRLDTPSLLGLPQCSPAQRLQVQLPGTRVPGTVRYIRRKPDSGPESGCPRLALGRCIMYLCMYPSSPIVVSSSNFICGGSRRGPCLAAAADSSIVPA